MPLNADLETTKTEFARASAGIRSPRIASLTPGDEIFRFASSRRPPMGDAIQPSKWALGAWWFPEASYRIIIQRYQAGKLALGTVARAAGAVQPSWSYMDVSIKARVTREVLVYFGRGKTQYRDQLPNGMFVTLQGWPDIEQIYIPGTPNIIMQALHVVRQKIVTTDNFGFS